MVILKYNLEVNNKQKILNLYDEYIRHVTVLNFHLMALKFYYFFCAKISDITLLLCHLSSNHGSRFAKQEIAKAEGEHRDMVGERALGRK